MMLRRHASRLVALLAIVALYGLARLPETPPDERRALAARFHFTPLPLPEVPGPYRTVRAVSPALAGISAWISSVGAGIALADLDGDGLANDFCQVEPRSDRVLVAPLPGSGARFAPTTLEPRPLAYDAATMAPMGCLPGDFDEDGRTDLLVYYWSRTPIAFLAEAGGGWRPVEVAARIERWYSNAAALADLDGDGHLDLMLGNYFPDGARILDATSQAPEAMQHSMSRATNGGSTRFFLGGGRPGAPRFDEVDAGLPDAVGRGWTLALGAADLDGDLLPEIYLANDFGPDRLLHNRSTPGRLRFALLEGERHFATPASKVLGRDSFKGMGIDFADLNGDGRLDLFVSNIAAEFALLESHFAFIASGDVGAMQHGIAPFDDRSEDLGLSRSGWGWDIKLADFDNDGGLEVVQATGFVKGTVDRWPELQELAMGNDELLPDPRVWGRFTPGIDISGHEPNPFFVRARDGRFVDLAAELGLAAAQVSRGIAIADVDGDGDLDFAVANQWEASVLYRNDCPACGHALVLDLRLPGGSGSRPAVGAEARVRLPDGRALVAHVDGGNGHGGKRSPELHFGLGRLPADAPLPVTLRWRDGDGRVRSEATLLRPGRHTVLLGAPTAVAASGGAL